MYQVASGHSNLALASYLPEWHLATIFLLCSLFCPADGWLVPKKKIWKKNSCSIGKSTVFSHSYDRLPTSYLFSHTYLLCKQARVRASCAFRYVTCLQQQHWCCCLRRCHSSLPILLHPRQTGSSFGSFVLVEMHASGVDQTSLLGMFCCLQLLLSFLCAQEIEYRRAATASSLVPW